MRKILIIGAGIIGLSIARALSKHNFKITILEKERAGKEASYAAAGMLAAQSEFDKYEPLMDLCIESNEMYPQFVREIERESGKKIGFEETGMIRPAFTKKQSEFLFNIYDWQKKKGYDIQHLTKDQILKKEPAISNKLDSALYLKNDHHVDNRKLTDALLKICKRNNVEVKEKTKVESMLMRHDEVIGVQANGKKVEADIAINCAGAWSSQIPETDFGVNPVAGQMVSLHTTKKILNHVIFSCDLKKDPYIVPRKNEILIGATMEHNGFNKDIRKTDINNLLKKSYNIIPELKNLKVKETWCGLRPYTADKLPIIGETKLKNLLIATAHGRNGILLAPITALAIEEAIMDYGPMPGLKEFSVDRFSKK